MADNETTTKVEDSSIPSSEEGAEETLSLEALDGAIAESDPEFMQSLTTIGPENADEIYSEGADLQFTAQDEIRLWENGSLLHRLLYRFLPFLPLLSFKLKVKKSEIRLALKAFLSKAKVSLKAAPKQILSGLKSILQKVKGILGAGLNVFKGYSLKQKLAFVGLIVASVLATLFLTKMFKTGLIPADQELFISSLSEWSGSKYTYTSATPLEPFYESTRLTQNILLLKKMIVNLVPSSESGVNPMGAFEFYVEGTVSEVVVEVKDREAEMTDLFRRTISAMNFDQVSSGEGKQLLCERLRKEMNAVLTKGLIRKVFIKTAILKP